MTYEVAKSLAFKKKMEAQVRLSDLESELELKPH